MTDTKSFTSLSLRIGGVGNDLDHYQYPWEPQVKLIYGLKPLVKFRKKFSLSDL
jgi:hypothetical protein